VNTLIIKGYRNIPCLKNNLKVSHRRKKFFPNRKAKEFSSYIQEIAVQYLGQHKDYWNTKKKYKFEIFVTYGEDNIDIHNVFDIICDSLQGIIYEDDSQIQSVYGEKTYEKNTWKFEIKVTML
jgi:Holliday junction resolvase RusA-like endonuclease